MIKTSMLINRVVYSCTSNKGHREIKGQPLYNELFQYPQECICNTFNLRKEDSLPTRDKMAGPKVSPTWRFHTLLPNVLSEI